MLPRHVAGGQDAPQVLLSHGVGDCAAGFATLIDDLVTRFRVIAVDHRGHGHAPRFDARQLRDPFPVLVGDLLAELTTMDCPLIYAHSMGAAIAAEAAIHRPDLVAGLILEDPAWAVRTPEETALAGEVRVEQLRQDLRDVPAAMARKIAREKWPVQEAAGWAAGRVYAQPEFLATGVVSGRRPWREQVALLAASDTPTLVVTGSGESAIVGQEGADEINAYPAGAENLRATVIDGAGHSIRRTRPTELARAIAQTLDWYELSRR